MTAALAIAHARRRRAHQYADAIGPAGPHFKAAGPDEAAGQTLRLPGQTFKVTRPDFEAAASRPS